MAQVMNSGEWWKLEGKYSTGVINQLKEMCEKDRIEQDSQKNK